MNVKILLTFNGNAQEALTLYQEVFKGAVTKLCKYGDYEDFQDNLTYKDKMIHSDLQFEGCTISLADAMPGTQTSFGNMGHTITIFCDTKEKLENIYSKLSVGGEIKCELCTPCYAQLYAEVIDRFGVLWALIIE